MKAEIWVEREDRSIEERIRKKKYNIYYARNIPEDRIPILIPIFQRYFKGRIGKEHFKKSLFIFYPENEEDERVLDRIDKIISGAELVKEDKEDRVENQRPQNQNNKNKKKEKEEEQGNKIKKSIKVLIDDKYEFKLVFGDRTATLRSLKKPLTDEEKTKFRLLLEKL